MTITERNRATALEWFRKELQTFRGTLAEKVKQFKSDYRCGSVAGTITLYCESGSLYQTTPERPSETLRLKLQMGNRTLAQYPIDDLVKEL